MRLSCIFYGMGDENFQSVFSVFRSAFGTGGDTFRIDAKFSDANTAARYIASSRSIHLLVVYVSAWQEEDKTVLDMDAIRLGRLSVSVNRDNYVIYLTQDNKVLLRVAPLCTRSVAVMSLDMFRDRGKGALEMVKKDYHFLTKNESSEEGKWIHLKQGNGNVARVHTTDIYALIAVNKELEVHTANGVLTISGSLDSMHNLLGDRFCRCHRSCLLNLDGIQYVDFPAMTIVLIDGTPVPLARSFRHNMSELVQEKNDAQPASQEVE